MYILVLQPDPNFHVSCQFIKSKYQYRISIMKSKYQYRISIINNVLSISSVSVLVLASNSKYIHLENFK